MNYNTEGDVQPCMDKGKFRLHHAWPWVEHENGRAEYWRGTDANGGVIFFRDKPGSFDRAEYFTHAGQALQAMDRSGYYVPGISERPKYRHKPIF